jgi:hypothetical protein
MKRRTSLTVCTVPRIAQLSSKSQLTLHQAEWRLLGVRPRDPIVMEVVRGALRLRRHPDTPRRSYPPRRRRTLEEKQARS